MSVSRIKYIKQYVPVSSYTYDSGNSVVSITTSSNHLLFTGVPIFLTSDKQYSAYNTVATVISANTITAPVTAVNYIQGLTHVGLFGYLPTQIGAQEAQTLPRATGTQSVVQSYVNGAGGAEYGIEVSLDTSHWIAVNTVTHGATSGNTMYSTISPGWAYMRANVTSIGTNTNLVIMTGE